MAAFDSVDTENYLRINCPQSIDGVTEKILGGLTTRWEEAPQKLIIFDFRETEYFSPQGYRIWVQMFKRFEQYDKKVVSIGLDSEINQQLVLGGLRQMFNPMANFHEALQWGLPDRPAPAKINAEFLAPFINGVSTTLKAKAGIEAKPSRSYLKAENPGHLDPQIAAIMALTSDEFTGSIALTFPLSTCLAMHEKLGNEKTNELTPDVEASARLFMEAILEHAKAELGEDQGPKIQNSDCTILTGDKLKTRNATLETAIAIPFASALGKFEMEIEGGSAT